MSNLIDTDKLVKAAKKEGVDFGKGDPYNRLRYYTKIGWLPHMTRREDKKGNVTGHYPEWVLSRLLDIEKYKSQGMSNEQITSKITTHTKLQTLYGRVLSKDFRFKVISYALLVALVFILLVELDLITVSQSKRRSLVAQSASSITPNQIIDSGSAFVPSGKKTVFIKNENIDYGSRVYVTFNSNFLPAVRYWVSKVEPQSGFYVEMDTPVFDNAEFSWWISK